MKCVECQETISPRQIQLCDECFAEMLVIKAEMLGEETE